MDIVVMRLDLADLSFADELMSKYVLYLVGFALLSQISLRLASHNWDMLAIGHQGRSLEPHGRRYLVNILHPKLR